MNNEEYQKRVLKILTDIRTLNESIDLRMSQQNQMNQKILEVPPILFYRARELLNRA